jgi:uncharacterized protein (UPF0210 family)
MRIRSVTIGTNVEYPIHAGRFRLYDAFQARARTLFAEAGLEVQTVRLATQPYPEVLRGAGPAGAPSFARELESVCQEHGIDYCSIGSLDATAADNDLGYLDVIPQVIGVTEMAFVSALVASRQSGIHLAAIQRAAQVIAQVAEVESSGFGNLRLAILANCAPGVPFFPAAYHSGGDAVFAVATEAADLAVESFGAETLDEARMNLRTSVEQAGQTIEGVSRTLETEFGLRFAGIDFSLAPYPERAISIGHAIEQLGVDLFGGNSTLFATALTTAVLREAAYPRCGFSGLMFPVLEDRTMAERSVEQLYGIDSLLLYSTVCGTGLDTVPLPGDVTVDELAAILLDMATLAVVHDKPLTARLMPVPGKRAGELTEYDFPYFCNGRILDVKGVGAHRIFQRNDLVRLP